MAQTLTGVLNLDLVGGSVCIDFANTVHNYAAAVPRDELRTYADLVRWSQRVGTIGEADAERLLTLAKAEPKQAEAALDRAKSLRRVVFDIFSAVSEGAEPEARDLDRLQRAFAESVRRGQLTTDEGRYEWRWAGGQLELGQLMWPIAGAAVELLTSTDVRRVHRCEADDCTWLFIDRSKNHSRRWCEMGSCGNRAKARRHYHRTQAANRG